MEAKKATLVTGAGGCIGAWAIRQLLSEGAPVIALDLRHDDRRLRLLVEEDQLDRVTWVQADVTDLSALRSVLAENEVGAVIHLAALQAPFCRADPPLGASVNVVGTVNLLEALTSEAELSGPFVYASSIAAETSYPQRHPATIYGVYKLACEGAADVYWRERGVASIGLRPHTVYGAGRDQGMTSAPTLAMLAAATGAEYEIPFTGRLTMQHAGDVAASFIAASRATSSGGSVVFDLPGPTVAVTDVVAAILAAEPGAAIGAKGEALGFAAEMRADSMAPREIGGEPMRLEDGIRATVAHFRDLAAEGRLEPSTP